MRKLKEGILQTRNPIDSPGDTLTLILSSTAITLTCRATFSAMKFSAAPVSIRKYPYYLGSG